MSVTNNYIYIANDKYDPVVGVVELSAATKAQDMRLKATQMAKNRLLREGIAWPAQRQDESASDYFTRVREYGDLESRYIMEALGNMSCKDDSWNRAKNGKPKFGPKSDW